MKTHFKSGMDKVTSKPENLNDIKKKLNESNHKETNFFMKFTRKYAAATIGLAFIFGIASLVFFNSQNHATSEEIEVTEVDTTTKADETTETVYMTLPSTSENSYAIDVGSYEAMKVGTDFVFTFKPVEEVDSYCTQSGLIYTIYSVEVTSSIKGGLSGTVLLSVPGGSVTVETYYNSIPPEAATKQFPNGIEHISDQLVVSDPAKTVSMNIGEEYLAFANYDESKDVYAISADVYGVYEVNDGVATNEYNGLAIPQEDW